MATTTTTGTATGARVGVGAAAGTGPAGFLVHRPVRAHPRPPPADTLTLAAPPAVAWTASNLAGWLQYLVPLLGSGGSAALLFAMPGPRSAWLVALVAGAAAASVVLGLGLRLVERRAARRARRRERARYLTHLDQVAAQAERRASAQLAVAGHLHPDLPTLWSLVNRTDRLWERRPTDDDFLTVRVGRGPVPTASTVRLDATGGPLVEHDPELLQAAETLVARAQRLPDAPVTVPLRHLGVLAVTGPPERTRSLVRSMLCQLAAFHAPDDLRILAAFPPPALADWAWLKWLPHTRDPTPTPDRPPTCLLAENQTQLDAHLARELPLHRTSSGSVAGSPPHGNRPHLLVMLDATAPGAGFAPAAGPSTGGPGGQFGGARFEELLGHAAAAGVTVVWLATDIPGEPSELAARVRIDDHGLATFQETAPGGRLATGIRADRGGPAFCEAIARRMAPLRLDRPPTSAAGAGPLRLLDLLDLVGRGTDRAAPTHPADRADPADPADSVDPMDSAHPTDPPNSADPTDPTGPVDRGTGLRPRSRTELLGVPVGMTPGGDPLALDLKEAAEGGIGPHGLVVGATGSGKSELLRTVVAGLAATHPPDQLAFVLVDFKGGAAFADLAPLPQVAGLITNLHADLSMVDRAMAALQGELARRQRLLHDAGRQPDLRAYSARRQADPRLEPLPYLLVVVDEFGELLAVRPEFLDLFIAIGRVGRSLGMHLLLASQRLDEGRLHGLDGHLRYRICLRTFSAAESTAVLGTPDAYHLPPAPGTALLKVDANPPFRFTAALVSTRGGPSPAGSGPPARPPGPSDLEVLVANLAGAGRRAHQVWLAPLPAAISLDELLERGEPGWLRVPVGVVDRPLEQVQEPLVLDLSGGAGHLAVVGAPRTGKSTLLCTIVAALAATHPPDAVQAYAIDLGGGLLHRFGGLPHVGAVCGPREPERAHRLVRELRRIVAERERCFRDLGVESMTSWHELRRAGLDLDEYGEVFLLVDNWGALVRELPELEAGITELAATGLHYGVHLVLAANRWAELRPALRDNLGGRLELRLNDPLESELGRVAAAALPELPGRGLIPSGLQFQAALAGPPQAVLDRALHGPGGAAAPPLRLLPELLAETALPAAGQGQPNGVPFAVEEHRLEPVWLDLFEGPPHLLVLGDGGCGKSSLLRLLAHGLAARHRPEEVALLVVDLRRSLLDLTTLPHLAGYACTTAMLTKAVAHLHRRLTEPMPPSLEGPPDPGITLWPPAEADPSLPTGPESTLDPPYASIPVSPWLPGELTGSGPPPRPVPPLIPLRPPGPAGAPIREGPRYVVLVDDYDLLPTATGSPLLPLLDLLGQGRELGLHLVLTRGAAGTARAAFEPIFQRLRELGGPGLIMSGDPGEGAILAGQRAAPLPPGRGLLVRPRQPPTLVQVAYGTPPARASTTAEASAPGPKIASLDGRPALRDDRLPVGRPPGPGSEDG
jgi:S-DNA-T family DNA segregation ATPase FtsK/SpoIIIE